MCGPAPPQAHLGPPELTWGPGHSKVARREWAKRTHRFLFSGADALSTSDTVPTCKCDRLPLRIFFLCQILVPTETGPTEGRGQVAGKCRQSAGTKTS